VLEVKQGLAELKLVYLRRNAAIGGVLREL